MAEKPGCLLMRKEAEVPVAVDGRNSVDVQVEAERPSSDGTKAFLRFE